MAIFGKSSIIEHVRSMGFVYWRIYQSAQDKNAGNYVASADFNNPNLGPEASMDALNLSLGRLTAGQYLLSCYEKPGQSKGGINTYIEVEGREGGGAISGLGNPQAATAFYLEGIGAVNAENFESAVEQKLQKMMDAQREKDRIITLEKELAELKKEKRESESGFQRGVLTIGSVLYGTVSKSPAGKEFIGMARDLFFQAKAQNNRLDSTPSGDGGEEVIGSVNTEEERLLGAVERLSKDNPDFLQQIEMLAKLKEEDPDTFNQAVDGLKSMA